MWNKINWWDRLKEMWILWQFDWDYSKPHALWTSWLHWDTFNNWSKLVENPTLLAEVAKWIIENLTPLIKDNKPDWIIWPAFWAITLWHEIARQLWTKFAFTEPVQTLEWKMQVLKRFDVKPWDTVLVVEDAISTWWSIIKTIDVMAWLWAKVMPFVATIVNWSWNDYLWDKKIYALFSWKPKTWNKEECILCKGWSEALRPKANRDKFTK